MAIRGVTWNGWATAARLLLLGQRRGEWKALMKEAASDREVPEVVRERFYATFVQVFKGRCPSVLFEADTGRTYQCDLGKDNPWHPDDYSSKGEPYFVHHNESHGGCWCTDKPYGNGVLLNNMTYNADDPRWMAAIKNDRRPSTPPASKAK